MSWLKLLQESFELMEYERGIKQSFTGMKSHGYNYEDSMSDSGGQVIRCGKVGRYLLYVSIKPYAELRRVKGRMNYLMGAIKKGGDSFIKKDMAEKELEGLLKGDSKIIKYVESKVRIKRPKLVNAKSMIRYLDDLMKGLSQVYSGMVSDSDIMDMGDSRILADDDKVEKGIQWGREECMMASEFFDNLGMPVGKNIPMVVQMDKVGMDVSAGHASHHQHYISVNYLSDKTLIHETAHYMWFYSMSAEMRKILALYFFTKVNTNVSGPSGSNMGSAFSASGSLDFAKDRSKFGKQPVLPSGYSTLNPAELWAEVIKAMSQGKASVEMKRLFRVVTMGDVSDLVKYFEIDPTVAQEYLSGSKSGEMASAINVSGKGPDVAK